MTWPVATFRARKEGGGAVALVVVRHGAGSALLQREAGLGAVQSLDLALLVEGEDHGVVRRVHVDAYHVVELLDEAGIAGKLEAPDLMRLESVLAPDPPDGHMVDSQGLAHQPTGPVGRLLGRRIFASRLLDDLLLDLAGDRAGSAGAGSVRSRFHRVPPLRSAASRGAPCPGRYPRTQRCRDSILPRRRPRQPWLVPPAAEAASETAPQDSRIRRSPRRNRNFLVVVAMDTNIGVHGTMG